LIFCFREDGGPSIAGLMGTAQPARCGLRADNRRYGHAADQRMGSEMRAMVGNDDGHAMIVSSRLVGHIRTIPFLQHDPDRLRT
jgi:hypothetical protein